MEIGIGRDDARHGQVIESRRADPGDGAAIERVRGTGHDHQRSAAVEGAVIGKITSGGFGPSVDGPIAMGYVASAHAAPGSALSLMVRGTPRPARVVPLPFVPHRSYRG